MTYEDIPFFDLTAFGLALADELSEQSDIDDEYEEYDDV